MVQPIRRGFSSSPHPLNQPLQLSTERVDNAYILDLKGATASAHGSHQQGSRLHLQLTSHSLYASSVVPSVSAVWPLVAKQPWPHSLHSLWPSCRAYCEEFGQIRFFPSLFPLGENVKEPVIHTRLIFSVICFRTILSPSLIYLKFFFVHCRKVFR